MENQAQNQQAAPAPTPADSAKAKGGNNGKNGFRKEIKLPKFLTKEGAMDLLAKTPLPVIFSGKEAKVMSNEINLVPDIKNEVIKTIKLRNFIFFVCIVVASACAGIIAIFASIAGGQQAAVDGKKATLAEMSNKVNSYTDLSDFLTIRDQLSNLSEITGDKKVLSRVFNVLSAMLPTGADTVQISELNVNLAEEAPTFSFDAQANAGSSPFIDYNVLDSFKKSMQYMRYDYGTYVDKEGADIPAYCIIESGADGATFRDAEKGYYALWLITGEGCNPSYTEEEEEDNISANVGTSTSTSNSNTTTSIDPETGEMITTTVDTTTTTTTTDPNADLAKQTQGYTTENYNGQTVVRIWRTPQYNDWYYDQDADGVNSGTIENRPYMSLSGEISNVAHFNSECITYSGTLDENSNTITWNSSNETCLLVPEGVDGIEISDSSNGRGASDELVLRFSAVITLEPEVFNFSNKHMLALGPETRYNVTDSYVQIQSMFTQRAGDCAEGDTACLNNVGGRS